MSLKKKNNFYLGLLLFFAFLLRIYHLDQLELFGDELDVGYQAYSLWTTGRDYLGQKLPFYLHSFSEWRAPLLIYFTAPFVGYLGLNPWAVRLPIVLLGLTNIFLLYLLVKKIVKSTRVAWLSAFILTITPWHLHYSRIAFEATLLLSLVILGVLAFLQKRAFLAGISFALALYSYNTANVFVPLFLLILTYLFWPQIKQKRLWLGKLYFTFFLLVLPLLIITLRGPGSARFKLIAIFNDPKIIDQIVFRRTTGLKNPLLERFFHNKLTGWGRALIDNYLTAFSPQFLFLSGDPNPRHNPPGWGQFYWFLAFWLVLGFKALDRLKERRAKQLLLAWLFLAPLPASLTRGGGTQATRLFLLLPPLVVLMALGLSQLRFSWFKKLSYGFILIQLLFWLHNYWLHYPQEFYQWWHYGYREAMSWLKKQEPNYQRIIINNNYEPALLRYLFWTQKEPAWLMKHFRTDQPEENLLPHFSGFRLGKVIFGSIELQQKQTWLEENLRSGDLYLAFQDDEVPGDWDWFKHPPAGLEVLKVVYDPWGKPINYWLTKK